MTKVSESLPDWSKAIGGLDWTKGTEGLLSMLAKAKVPGVNMDALVASQRDNLEALGAANRAALEGLKAAGEWQMKLMQETMSELTAAVGGIKGGSPQQILATESEVAKKAFETAIREMRELADIVTKANKEATEAIVKRIPGSLDGIKDVLKFELPHK